MPIEAQRKPDGSKWVTAPMMQTKGSKFVKFQEARLQVRAPPGIAWGARQPRPRGLRPAVAPAQLLREGLRRVLALHR